MRLTSTPILMVPKRGQRYTVYCDASKDGLGCFLMQSGRVMAYGCSKRITSRITLRMIWSWQSLSLP